MCDTRTRPRPRVDMLQYMRNHFGRQCIHFGLQSTLNAIVQLIVL